MSSRLSLCFFLLLFCPSSFAEKSDFEKTGDILQIALPVSALALTYVKSSAKNTPWKVYLYPFLKSYSAGFVTVHAQKLMVNKRRPNGDNTRSFPSGHTFSAFSGAAFNNTLYGYGLGIPSYAAAAIVGLSRIDAKQHFADDVIAGASIAMMYNWYFTESLDQASSIEPMILADKGTTLVGISGSTEALTLNQTMRLTQLKFRYSFGPSDINQVKTSIGNQTLIELTGIPREQKQIFTSKLNLEYFFLPQSSAFIDFHPFQWVNRGLLRNNLVFSNASFFSGDAVVTDWTQYNMDLGYRYRPNWASALDISVGGGTYLYHSQLKVEKQDSSLRFEESKSGVFPFVELGIFPNLSKQIQLGLLLSGIYGVNKWFYKLNLLTHYRMSDRWGLSLQFTQSHQNIVLNKLQIKSQQNIIFLGLDYNFF